MSEYFERLPLRFEPGPLLEQLNLFPEVWNRHPARRGTNSPHRETSDVWLRFHPDGLPPTAYESFCSVWFPEGNLLSEAKKICFSMMQYANAGHLGGILITRISPGKRVYCHSDLGPWHAGFHEFKCYIALKSNEECVNYFGPNRDSFVMKAGEVWKFNNQVEHECLNSGVSDRISLIVSMSCK